MSKNAANRDGSTPVASPAPRRWLFPVLALAGIVALVVAGVVWLRPGNTNDTPEQGARVAVEQDMFDYGDVAVNTPIETVFRVKNVGTKPLKILGEPKVLVVEGC